MLTAHRTGNTMGAEVTGADLSQPMDAATFEKILAMFLEHKVLVFRSQTVTAPQFLAWARRFGRPEPHVLDQFHHPDHPDILVLSNVVKDGKALGLADGGTYWHSDYSYLEIPARATTLFSIQVPKVGGDTLFSDQVSAYADLPEAMKKRIDGLVAIHHYGNRDDMDPPRGPKLTRRISARRWSAGSASCTTRWCAAIRSPAERDSTRCRARRWGSWGCRRTKDWRCCANWPRTRLSRNTSSPSATAWEMW